MSFDIKIRNGDIVYRNGAADRVKDEDKLTQSLVKILLTEIRPYSLRPGYGTNIEMIPQAIVDTIRLAKMEDSVKGAISYLINEQRRQVNYQYLSPGEIIRELLAISVNRSSIDPRQFEIYIVIRAGSGNIVEKKFYISPNSLVQQQKSYVNIPAEAGGYTG